MKKYEEVVVSWSERDGVKVDKEKVTLYFNAGLDSMRWVVGSAPPDAESCEIRFKGKKSPFLDLAVGVKPGKPTLIGTGNTKVKGSFAYGIVFHCADGTTYSLDPVIENEDDPPN